MALTETTEYDRIEVVTEYKHVQVRKATVIKKDDKELSRSFERYSLAPDADISNQPEEVKVVCNTVWTDAVKNAWKSRPSSSP